MNTGDVNTFCGTAGICIYMYVGGQYPEQNKSQTVSFDPHENWCYSPISWTSNRSTSHKCKPHM